MPSTAVFAAVAVESAVFAWVAALFAVVAAEAAVDCAVFAFVEMPPISLATE